MLKDQRRRPGYTSRSALCGRKSDAASLVNTEPWNTPSRFRPKVRTHHNGNRGRVKQHHAQALAEFCSPEQQRAYPYCGSRNRGSRQKQRDALSILSDMSNALNPAETETWRTQAKLNCSLDWECVSRRRLVVLIVATPLWNSAATNCSNTTTRVKVVTLQDRDRKLLAVAQPCLTGAGCVVNRSIHSSASPTPLASLTPILERPILPLVDLTRGQTTFNKRGLQTQQRKWFRLSVRNNVNNHQMTGSMMWDICETHSW